MTTRMNNLQTAAKNAALEAVYEGMDANAFYVQTVARTNLAQMLSSGYQALSTNCGQAPLDITAITGIDNDVPAQLVVHHTTVANALGRIAFSMRLLSISSVPSSTNRFRASQRFNA